ncbi:MAG: hypothetical protein RIT17_1460 [Pseudomonadota bacterium]|jgi:hypothetical protein
MNTPYAGPRQLDFDTLLSRSFENLWLIRKEIAIYLVIVTVAAFTLPLVGQSLAGGAGIASYLIGQYWLFQSLLKARGMLETTRNHILAFVGLAALLIFPIMFGIAAFVLPGLFLVARWIAAPAFVAARGRGVFAAAGDSWETVRGNTGKLAGAVVVMFLIVSFLGTITGLIDGTLTGLGADSRAKPLDLIELQLLPLLLLGLSVATYELLGPKDTMIEDVFG